MSVPDSPLTCLDLWCKAGSSFEKEGEEGLAHFLEHMIFKGSSRLKEGQFDEKIEALGGSSNAATGYDDVHYYVLVPPKGVQVAIDLLLNLVLTPSLNEAQYLLEKEVVLEEIAQNKDQPEEHILQSLLENCWPNHPYGRSILGLEESLKASEPILMRGFHDRQYIQQNLSLSIAGFIPPNIEEILNQSELTTSKELIPKDSFTHTSLELPFRSGRKEIRVPRLESVRITMAWSLPPANNQLMLMGADLTSSLLAEGRRSRLVHHLRENLQIVDSIDMGITVLEQGSLFILEASCIEDNLEKVENEIKHILSTGLENEPSPKEMMRAKQLVRNSILFGLELPSQIAGITASQALWNRNQSLLEPLKHLDFWDSSTLKNNVFPQLHPDKGFTLISRPKIHKT